MFPELMERKPCSQRIWPIIAGTPHRVDYISALGVKTRILVAGSRQRAVIELVPPLFLTLDTFLYVLPELTESYFVVTYDKPGRGFSEKASFPQTVSFLANHLISLVDELGIRDLPIVLSGSGFGGWVVARAASTGRLGNVRGLILNNPGNPRPHVIDGLRRANLQEVEEGSLEAARNGFRRLLSSEDYLNDDLVCIRYATHLLFGREPLLARKNIEYCLNAFRSEEDSWDRDWVEAMKIPTLIIWSSQNKIDHLSDYDTFINRLPSVTLKIIEGGMLPQIEQPRLFVSLHRDFIEEVLKDGS
jgi:pimeloyl-ACP methyl ester carboxylesterase